MQDDVFHNSRTELGHSFGQPNGHTSSMQGQIGDSGALHYYQDLIRGLGTGRPPPLGQTFLAVAVQNEALRSRTLQTEPRPRGSGFPVCFELTDGSQPPPSLGMMAKKSG